MTYAQFHKAMQVTPARIKDVTGAMSDRELQEMFEWADARHADIPAGTNAAQSAKNIYEAWVEAGSPS